MRKVRLCHIAATADGAVWMVEQLRELRDRRGYDVEAIIGTGEGTLPARLREAGIKFHTVTFQFPAMPGGVELHAQVTALAALLRKQKYDIVQTHLFASMVIGRLAAWQADVPVRLAMIAGPYHLEAYTPRWIDASTCWMDSGLIPSCQHAASIYRSLGVADRRVSLAYYGPDEALFDRATTSPVDLRAEFDLPRDSILVGMIAYFYPPMPAGRWTPPLLHDRPNKRQTDLIEAAPVILKAFPKAKILLIGSGWGPAGAVEFEKAKQLTHQLGLQDSVIFTGARRDVNEVLAGLDVTVQASVSENLGGTIEALLMECPTVATATGGLVDTVIENVTGILVRPLDPVDLGNGIVRMLSDRDNARAMAKTGRALMIERFSLTRTIADLDRIYTKFAGSKWWKRRGYRPWQTHWRPLVTWLYCRYIELRIDWDTTLPARIDYTSRQLERLRAIRWRCRARVTNRVQAARGYVVTLWRLSRRDWKTGVRNVAVYLRRLPTTVATASTAARTGAADAVTRFGAWFYLKMQLSYGFLRYLARDTRLLRRWDKFLMWLRGRPPTGTVA